jgi:hypothetical protein
MTDLTPTFPSSGRGRVCDPARDGRLKSNRDSDVRLTHRLKERVPCGQGRVVDPTKDRRIKANKERAP